MPQFVPVDYDPFAEAPPPQAAPNGAAPPSAPGLRLVPVDHDPFADEQPDSSSSTDGFRSLTIRGGSGRGAPNAIGGSAAILPADFAPKPGTAPAGISYADAVAAQSPTPNPGGTLSNAADDGYLSGLAKGAGTAIIKGVSDLPGVFGNAMDFGDYLGARALAKIQGRPADEVLKEWADDRAASAANPSWTRYLDPRNFLPSGQQIAAPVLKQTGEYVPTTEPGRMAMSAGEAAVGGLITPGMGGVRGLLPNAAAGGAGQGAADVTQDPLYGAAAGLVAAPAAGVAGSGLAKVAVPALQGARVFDRMPVVGPMIQRSVNRSAAQSVLDAAADPQAVRDWAAAPPQAPAVPGSLQTIAAQTGDMGLLGLEKAARQISPPTGEGAEAPPTYFNALDKARSDAQLAAIKRSSPPADVLRPGQMLSARMDAVDQAAQDTMDRLTAAHADAMADRTQALMADTQQADATRQAKRDALAQAFQDASDRQLQAAQTAAEPLGERANADELGATLRGAIEEVRTGAKQLHRGLYNTVDPDGTLALVASPVRDKAASIMQGVAADGSELSGVEAPLFRRAATLPDVASYRSIHALDRDVGAAMATERRSAGETPAWNRLTQLKGAVKSAIIDATDNQVAHEARLVAAGQMAPEDTLAARVNGLTDEWNAAGQQATARANTGTGYPADSAYGTAVVPQSRGTDSSGEIGPRNAARGESLPPASGRAGQGAFREVVPPEPPLFDDTAMTRAPQRPDVPRPESLASFVRRNGGMRDEGGDLRSMGLDRLIAKVGGLHPDKMREAAAEAGYLGGDTTRAMSETGVNDLLNALEDGDRRFSVRDEDALHAWDHYDVAKDAWDRQRAESEGRSTPAGVRPKAPLSTYGRDDIYAPGTAPEPPTPANDLVPTFDKAAANRLKTANAAFADFARTYKNPIVGPGLKVTGYAGQYARSNSAFIKGAIRPGAEGYEAARAHLLAAKNDPAAIGAMHEAALNPLRKAVTGNGTLSPRALASWKEGYGPALRALDEVSPGFSSQFDSAAHATQALVDLGQQHEAALKAYQAQAAAEALAADQARKIGFQADRSAAKANLDTGIGAARDIQSRARASVPGQFGRKFGDAVSPAEAENAVGGYLKTGTAGVTRMRGLIQAVSHDPDALAGLRRAGTDWMARTLSNAGTGELSPARFIDFLRQNRDVLRELYPPDQMSMFGAVARDLEAGTKWLTTNLAKGGTDTTANLARLLGKVGEKAQHLSISVVAMEALKDAAEGEFHHAALAVGAASGAYLLSSLRAAGIRRIGDLTRELLADPAKARAFLARMPASPDSGVLHNVARVMKRAIIVGPAVGARPEKV